MKDVKHCSISSVAFTLEVDAYERLLNYISSISERYTDNADGTEIVADIEARIAELILAVQPADRVVAKPLIDNIIAQMGSVDDICDPMDEHQSDAPPTPEEPKRRPARRLYRNVDDAPIGGVCSGIAAFIGCPASVVRLIALLLVFFGGASLWVYIILWILMPAATTARQKLEMRGEPITVSSIRDFYDSLATPQERKTIVGSAIAFIGRVILVLLKIILICIVAGLIVALVGVFIGMFSLCIYGGNFSSDITMGIVALSAAAVLLGLGIYTLSQVISSRTIKRRTVLSIFIVWLLLAMLTASISTLYHRDKVKEKIEEFSKEFKNNIKFEVQENKHVIIFEDCDTSHNN